MIKKGGIRDFIIKKKKKHMSIQPVAYVEI